MASDVILKFDKVSKFFPGVVANDKVDLEIRRGEVHTLLGENGAGKSTLMNILYGLYKADEGKIYINGEEVTILSPNDAIKHGIGMIHQHFMLINNFTVWENVTLGKKMPGIGKLPLAELKDDVRKVAAKMKMNIDPDAVVHDLSVGVQQKIEILKAIYRGSKILILDEPTSVLTPQESEELFVTLNELKADGTTIIFISHKLNEVMQISDRVSVLRDGVLIKTIDIKDATPSILTSYMVGRDVTLDVDKPAQEPGAVKLKVSGINAKGDTRATTLKDVSFEVHAGEVVGIAGVDGNGQDTLSSVIAGIMKPESGAIEFDGENVTSANVRERMDHHFSYIPSDRRGQGLTMNFKLYENVAMTQYYNEPYSKKGVLSIKGMKDKTKEYIEAFNVKAPSTDVWAANLSGGNQQKLVLAREMMKEPEILLIVQPTWGLDIGATAFVYEKIMEERARGAAILLISTDLEEVRSLSDRLLVLFEGEIMGEVDPAVAKVEEIGQMMAGSHINNIQK